MNQPKSRLFTVLAMLLVSALAMQAQQTDVDYDSRKADEFVEQQQKKQAKELKKRKDKQERIDTQKTETYTTPVYMFSISAEFGDSMVYVTGVQQVENVQLTKKYDYLYFRSDYSQQFAQFLGNTYGASNQTTCVIFDKSKKKLVKRFMKIMKHYEENPDMHINLITADRFHFKAVEDFSNVQI